MSIGGDLIHEGRLRAGLSQAALAERLGTSQPAVARWERGRSRPPMDRVLEALRACGLDLAVRVVDRDDHDLELALANVRLSERDRLRQLVEMGAFAARAVAHGVADRVSESVGGYGFRPEEILVVLSSFGVEYVLIGGLAAVFHGAPHFTGGVDICPRRTCLNLECLASALESLDAHVQPGDGERVAFPEDAALTRAEFILRTTTAVGELNVVYEPSGTGGFDDLRRAATTIDLDGIAVPVASLADVIRSKEAANRPRDQAVLHVLRELLRRQPRG